MSGEVQQRFADVDAGTCQSPHCGRAATSASYGDLLSTTHQTLSCFTTADVESIQKTHKLENLYLQAKARFLKMLAHLPRHI